MRLLVLSILCVLFSCRPDLPDKAALSKEIYDRKVQKLYRSIDSKCKSEAYRNAELHVDKLVDKWINSSIHDTIDFPAKPTKPGEPDPILGTVERFDPDTLIQ